MAKVISSKQVKKGGNTNKTRSAKKPPKVYRVRPVDAVKEIDKDINIVRELIDNPQSAQIAKSEVSGNKKISMADKISKLDQESKEIEFTNNLFSNL